MTPAAATILRARGFALCKPDPGGKAPTYKGWSARSLDATDFCPDDPIGILGGPLSDGSMPGHALVIIDLDCMVAVEKADLFLPATGMIEGRAGKPRSHRYYLVPVESIPVWARSLAGQGADAATKATGHPGPFLKHFKHRADKTSVLDFIGTGGQVVCPHSLHPCGERREWVIDEEGREPDEPAGPGIPAVVPFVVLWDATCKLATECGATIPTVNGAADSTAGTGKGKSRSTVPPGIEHRAIKYLEKMEPSIDGQDGHGRLLAAASAVVWGFDLAVETGFRLLKDFFNPQCQPA
jgi:hypothetical protein